MILDCFRQSQELIQPISTASTSWAIGKRHIFLSEGARQQLERLRSEKRTFAATLIQATWRGYFVRRCWPAMKQNLIIKNLALKSNSAPINPVVNSLRPRPQPITGTPPPSPAQHAPKPTEMCDQKIIQQTCLLYGIDLVSEFIFSFKSKYVIFCLGKPTFCSTKQNLYN